MGNLHKRIQDFVGGCGGGGGGGQVLSREALAFLSLPRTYEVWRRYCFHRFCPSVHREGAGGQKLEFAQNVVFEICLTFVQLVWSSFGFFHGGLNFGRPYIRKYLSNLFEI